MSKYRRLQLFFQQVAFDQATLARLTVSALAGLLGEKLIDRTTWGQRGNTVNLLTARRLRWRRRHPAILARPGA